MKVKSVKVKLDASTWRWLRAYAKANSNTQLNNHKVTPEDLLEQAAFCFGDAAGRRDGSWEADVGGNMLIASGFQAKIAADKIQRLQAQDGRAR